MRARLRVLAAVWLACQLIALASPLTLFSDSFGIDQASCCPGIAPGQTCPMHHNRAADRSTCKMESACAHHDAALLTIFVTGILPTPRVAIGTNAGHAAVVTIRPSTLLRGARPDAPPPRTTA